MGKNKTKRTKRNHLRSHKKALKAIEAINTIINMANQAAAYHKMLMQASKCLTCEHNYERKEPKHYIALGKESVLTIEQQEKLLNDFKMK